LLFLHSFVLQLDIRSVERSICPLPHYRPTCCVLRSLATIFTRHSCTGRYCCGAH